MRVTAGTTWRRGANRLLDRLIRPEVRLLGHPWPTFQLCGFLGLTLALLLAGSLVRYEQLSGLVVASLAAVAVATFFGLAFAVKLLTGEEQLVYYHHEISILMSAAALLAGLGQPLLPYLDVTALGLGTFLACGRIGCLMAGCCHGRPHPWGVCYGPAHAAAGAPAYLVGVRLFPVQAVEALGVSGIVLVGVGLVLGGAAPGSALAWYLAAYNLIRFGLEFLRGDPERPYHGGFSSAQWLAVGLTGGIVLAEAGRLLPFQPWHSAACAVLVAALLGVSGWRAAWGRARFHLLQPRHVREVAAVLDRVASASRPGGPPGAGRIQMGTTSLGLRISASQLDGAGGRGYHYAFSGPDGLLTAATARLLADLVLRLRHPEAAATLLVERRGIFHLSVAGETDPGPAYTAAP